MPLLHRRDGGARRVAGQISEAAGDTFISVEFIQGSTTGAYTLRGDALNNDIYGNGGNDTLNGRAGLDRLYGGAGADTLTGETGQDRFSYNFSTEGGDFITDFLAADDSIALKSSGFGGILQGGVAAVFFVNATGNT